MTEQTPPTLAGMTRGPARPNGRTYPEPGTTLARAWSEAWKLFQQAPGDGWLAGTEVAQRAAEVAGVEPTTVQNVILRFCRDGVLERGEPKVVAGKRGMRKHATFRVAR